MTDFVLEGPYEGPVHQLKEMSVTKGKKQPTVKCGAELKPRGLDEWDDDWTAWSQDITCEECLKGS